MLFVCKKILKTNDIAEINEEGKFRILGRKDNTINSGGVKIQIEQVESRLRKHLDTPFLISARQDAKFGEIVVLIYNKVENPPFSCFYDGCRRLFAFSTKKLL